MTSHSNRPPKRQRYKVPDHELWREVARHVTPLQPPQPDSAEDGTRGAQRSEEAPPARPEPSPPRRGQPAPGVSRPRRTGAPPPGLSGPDLTGIDRRMRRRLGRGDADIDARLDLHGQSVEQARVRLQRFLAQSRAEGHRLVLVITGKGASPFARHTLHGVTHFHAPERQGRLRRMVIEWLSEPEFHAHVSGFQPAHPRHGGGGAFYVRLRRPKPGAP